ncbi:hypothetical protein G3577_07755 [Morganella morganii]|uniref:hypothetical protein n=1 Tax=Morganella morganii TaxID=582 RepID=UPI0013A73E4A|nr:hypothetical protein [Morganella morganii]EJD6037745.1 hypothetical protein [Morganella morganii]QIC11601.1 hypothetical protein G3577_05910 [Morganella morganii]QIC11929.1 hypothetical protein G3577_07755 [Morganella morganii]
MWPFRKKEITEVVYLQTTVCEKPIWLDFEKEPPPISHDELIIKDSKGRTLIARYLSGDCWGGDCGFYFHDDRRVKYFKVVKWMKIPD